MYTVLTKNDDGTWHAIHELDIMPTEDVSLLIDGALASGVPLTGMNVTSHKSKAIKGAVWDGSVFSGGVPGEGVPLDTDEIWNTREKYSFLSDNKIIVSFTVDNDNDKSQMFEAAFSGETILVKNLSKPFNKIGRTFTLDGTSLTLVE
jgi:hypothetical protein